MERARARPSTLSARGARVERNLDRDIRADIAYVLELKRSRRQTAVNKRLRRVFRKYPVNTKRMYRDKEAADTCARCNVTRALFLQLKKK